jgi:uncharacterized protein YbaA (DUF1428 family)
MYFPNGSNVSITPATPNWYVARLWEEHGTRGVSLESVVAWMIVHAVTDYSRGVQAPKDEKCCIVQCYPITADGVIEDIEQHFLKDPDGRFTQTGVRSYDNEEELFADWDSILERSGKEQPVT